MNCSSGPLLYVPPSEELDHLDSLFEKTQLIRDFNDIKVGVRTELSFPISKMYAVTNFEGLIQANAFIDSSGLLIGSKVMYPQNLGVDYLIIPQIEAAEYESAGNMEGIDSDYVIEIKIPLYIQPYDTSEYDQWKATPPSERGFDVPPEPYGGFSTIQKKVIYPERGRKKGISGEVVIGFFLDSSGRTGNFQVLKSLGYEFDKSALDAVVSTKWKPATLEGVNVPYGISVPVVFMTFEEPS